MMHPEATAGEPVTPHHVHASLEGEAEAALSAEFAAETTVAEMLAHFANVSGRPLILTMTVTLEDAETGVAASTSVCELLGGKRRGRVHLHRCERIKAHVAYQERVVAHEFSPAATVDKVFEWCIGPQGLKLGEDARDLVLQLSGSVAPLEAHVHIGALARDGHCALKLELVPHDRHQGWTG